MDYWVFKCRGEENDGAIIDFLPENCPAEWRFNEGETLIKAFPKNVELKFSSNYPDNRKLYDFVDNIIGIIIASQRVKDVVGKYEKNVEFLPVALVDHKGSIAGESYYIINLLGSQEVMDMEKSKYKMGNIDKNQIKRIKNLQINDDIKKSDSSFFREKNMLRLFLLRDDLYQAFVNEGFKGFGVWEADGWDGLYI